MDQSNQPSLSCPARGGPLPLHDGLLVQDPRHLYAALHRRYGPIASVELGPGIGAWLVMGHQDVLELVRNDQAFSSDARRWKAVTGGLLAEDSPLLAVLGWRPAVNRLDDEAHRRQRHAVAEALSSIDLRRLGSVVRVQAETLIDRWSAHSTADLLSQYGAPLVGRIFRVLIGLAPSEEGTMGALLAPLAAGTSGAARAEAELMHMLHRLVADKVEVPGPDLTSRLLAHSARLTEAEVAHNVAVILLSGAQSTLSWIHATMRLLLVDARLHTAVATGRLTIADAADRALTDGSPVPNIAGRWARNDLTFAGRRVRAGDLLIPCLTAANTELIAHGAQELGSRAHLAWGAGSHRCPAADVARSVAETAVTVALRRLGALQAVDTAVRRQPSLWCAAPDELPVNFTPVPPSPGAAAALVPPPVMAVPDKRHDEPVADSGPATPRWGWWNSLGGW
ncbi:cytochrome P450 [Streptomyces sp. NPDC093600]|uniref:cytochrome P450 n=1 Tax=Streptomyces sp. NPDC093600 TaxID=3366047 RepID=UPI0037F91D86